ncbi:MAG: sugar ABC transporter permease [Chloroflexi bacterium]|nr:sugar ABC transporter permease [Chloroflexota bacterium]
MTEARSVPKPPDGAPERLPRTARSLLASTEVDTRLLGMLLALAIIWIGFNILSGGLFLTPRNLWNLSVQTSAIAIMATGMVLIIVSRNIDLSIGSILGFAGYSMAMLQAIWIPETFGLGFNQPYTWIIALAFGILIGAAIGGFQGTIIAYLKVPAFIVTLGGLLVWRGLIFELQSGQTIAPMDTTFRLLGGGPTGSIGEVGSWAFGVIACLAIVATLVAGRRRRRKYGFPLRPMWAEVAIGVIGSAVVLGAVLVANSYPWPEQLAAQYAADRGIDPPPGGLNIPTGIAYPVFIMIGVTLVMTFIATRLRFGRYVFAIGGNPDAAELGGINTRRTIMMTFVLMGILAAISGAIQTARLNAGVTSMGIQNELDVIAAAVIGGTSFSGGIGTIPGAVLGAVVMQSLRSGMVLLKVDSPIQDIVVGTVLVAAVGLDTLIRRRTTR